jgi:hypothetical protein
MRNPFAFVWGTILLARHACLADVEIPAWARGGAAWQRHQLLRGEVSIKWSIFSRSPEATAMSQGLGIMPAPLYITTSGGSHSHKFPMPWPCRKPRGPTRPPPRLNTGRRLSTTSQRRTPRPRSSRSTTSTTATLMPRPVRSLAYAQTCVPHRAHLSPGRRPADAPLAFLSIGGEGTVKGAPQGYVSYLAKNDSALLVSLEHRFYGNSVPNG